MLKIFGAVGSGSIPIEATLTLLGIPYEVIEAVTWEDEAARKRVEAVNPLRQIPALVLPSGEVMGWRPVGVRSIIASRRCPSPTGPSTNTPASSGPR